MQQQRALEALPCIALTPTYIHTLHTQNAHRMLCTSDAQKAYKTLQTQAAII